MVGLKEERVVVREGVSDKVTAKRRMITLQACKEERERGTEREEWKSVYLY